MSGHLPLYRLATLLARQLSAPIATRIKAYARLHPVFQREVCVRLGHALHVADTRFKLWTLRLPQPRVVAPLPEAVSLNSGADVLGEIVIFTLGASIVIFEVNRQANIQEAKKLAKVSEWLAVRMQLEELVKELQHQDKDLERMRAVLDSVVHQREISNKEKGTKGWFTFRSRS